MALLSYFLLGCITIVVVNAAPSTIEEDISPADANKEAVESLITVDDSPKDTVRGQRQKRWYNFYGYGFPPLNPINYPTAGSFNDQREDPFLQIYRKLKDISSFVRIPNQQPAAHQFPQGIPVFFPILFIPQFGNCRCNPENIPAQPDGNNTVPNVPSRFPDMDDSNQNWGIAANESEDDPNEYDRPISFNPIPPQYPTMRPPPPVEHGSSQGDSSNAPQTTTTTTTTPANQLAANSPSEGSGKSPPAPTPCDGAILSCCHQPQVTYNCFADQGCPDISAIAFNGNPCDPAAILVVVEKFQKFYGERTG